MRFQWNEIQKPNIRSDVRFSIETAIYLRHDSCSLFAYTLIIIRARSHGEPWGVKLPKYGEIIKSKVNFDKVANEVVPFPPFPFETLQYRYTASKPFS